METATQVAALFLVVAISVTCTHAYDTGATGFTGNTGFTGIPGRMGRTGAMGPPGTPGLRGVKGMDGATGAPGVPGPYSGQTGGTGFTGPGGRTGATGSAGIPGPPGTRGPPGLPGAPGRNVQIGAVAMAETYTDSDYILLYFSLTIHAVMGVAIIFVLIWQQVRISDAGKAVATYTRSRPPSYQEQPISTVSAQRDKDSHDYSEIQ